MPNYDYNVINISLIAGLDDYEIIVDAEKIIYLEGTQELDVRLGSNSADKIPLRPKMEIVAPFQKLYISANVYDETITLLIAKPQFFQVESKEVNVDTVNTISLMKVLERDISWYYDVLIRKNMYIAGNDVAASSSNYSACCLFNSVGSGITAIIKCMEYNTDVSTGCFLMTLDDLTGWTPTNYHANQYVGGADAKTIFYKYSQSSLPVGLKTAVFEYSGSYSTTPPKKHSCAIALPEGYGFGICTNSTNINLITSFNWIEGTT